MRPLGAILAAALLAAPSASAAPVVTAPTGDLDQDGVITVADLQCMILVFDRWATASPLLADACLTDGDCADDDRCAPVFADGYRMCLPACLQPVVTLGPDPAITCADGDDDADCLDTVHRRNADLDCNGTITAVDIDFEAQLVLGLTEFNDVDGDGLLNFCDPDTDGDGADDDIDCAVLDPTTSCVCTGQWDEWLTSDIVTQPGSIQPSMSPVTDDVAAWHTKQSNVVSRVLLYDRLASGWHVESLPTMYYGGKATLEMIASAGDVVWFSHPFPDSGNASDRLYRFDAGPSTISVTDLKDLNGDPGDIVSGFVAVTPDIAGFHTQRSNVVARVFVHRRAEDSWEITTLPGKSTGGAANLSAIAAGGESLVTVYPHPQFGTDGDLVTLYQVGAAEPTTWHTLDLHPDPGDLHSDTLRVTDHVIAWYAQRSNVISHVFLYNRALDTWTIETMPGMYYGGTAEVHTLEAAGTRVYFAHRHPESGADGDRLYVYDAATDTLDVLDTQDEVDDAPDIDPTHVRATPSLLAMYAQFSNVWARVLVYQPETDTWRVESMPGKSTGGVAEVQHLEAAGDHVVWTYRHPQFGTWGDIVTRYDAATDTLLSEATADVQDDPGDIVEVRITEDSWVAYTQRSNVTARLWLRPHCQDTWDIFTFPGKSTGGTATLGTLRAAGSLAAFTYSDPEWPPDGDVVRTLSVCPCGDP